MSAPTPRRAAVRAITAARGTAEPTRRTGAIGGAAAGRCTGRARRRGNRLAGSGTRRHGRRRDRLAIGRLRRHRQAGRRRQRCAGPIVGSRPRRCWRFVGSCRRPPRRRQNRPRRLLAARSNETPRRRQIRRRGARRRNIGRARRGRLGLCRRSRGGWGGHLGIRRGRGPLRNGLRYRRRCPRRLRLSRGRTSGPGRRWGLLRLAGVVELCRTRGRRSRFRR